MNKPPVFDPEGQVHRRREVYNFLLPCLRPFFAWDGARVTDSLPDPHDKRLRLYVATALLAGGRDDIALADALVREIRFTHACHFCISWVFSILHRYEKTLSPEAVRHLDAYVQRYLVDLMTSDYECVGANDNAPVECATALVLAGERYHEPSYTHFGRQRLAGLDAVLDRRGTIFECNSPTYSAITLCALAELAELAQDAEVQRIALRAEQRVWQEVGLTFHPETLHQMGPYTRAYEDDLLQHSTEMTFVIYQALGAIQPTNPLAMLGEPVANTCNHNVWEFARCSALRAATPDYHPAPETVELFHRKPVPFRVRATNEFMAMSGRPGGATTIDMYLGAEYGLGTFGSRLWAGQTTPFSVSYRRRAFDPRVKPLEYLAAVRTVFSRYVISEKFNGMMSRDPSNPAERNREFIYDKGVAVTVQQDNTALVCYQPANVPGHTPASGIRTLKLCIVFPQHHSRVEEIWIGDRRYPSFAAAHSGFAPIFVKDGPVYLAFHPLVVGQQDAMLADILLETQDDYGMISLFNMSGFQGCAYDEQQFARLGNGFVCEIGDEHQHGTYETFREKIFAGAVVQDVIWGRERRVHYRRPDRDLSLAYDIHCCAVRYATLNGQPVPCERLATDSPALLVQ